MGAEYGEALHHPPPLLAAARSAACTPLWQLTTHAPAHSTYTESWGTGTGGTGQWPDGRTGPESLACWPTYIIIRRNNPVGADNLTVSVDSSAAAVSYLSGMEGAVCAK
jgi:hypothetical protein